VKVFKAVVRLFLLVCIIVGAISGYVGWDLMHPARQKIDTTPDVAGLQYETVNFASRTDALNLQGWLIKVPANKQTILFAHGYGKNRLQNDVPLLPVVKVLVNHGYNVVMFDFRNCGASDGNLTSLGQYEVRDLLGAVDFVRERADLSQKITLFGFSMGAAVAIMAAAEEPFVAAVVSDSPYADLKTYLEKNLSVWTNLPAVPFNQSILLIVPPLTGITVEKVSPVQAVRKLGGRPLLLIHGDADIDVPLENSETLQKAYPAAALVRMQGAAHVKSFSVDEKRYLTEVTGFLEKI